MLFKTNIKQTPSEDRKIPLKFDVTMLNMLIGYFKKGKIELEIRS